MSILLLATALADEAGLETYLERRLEVVEVRGNTFYARDYDGGGLHWSVRQGGDALRADQLARALGDVALARKLKRRRAITTGLSTGGLVAGGVLVPAGLVVALPLSGVGAVGILGGFMGLGRAKTSAHPSWVWTREEVEAAVATHNAALADEVLGE